MEVLAGMAQIVPAHKVERETEGKAEGLVTELAAAWEAMAAQAVLEVMAQLYRSAGPDQPVFSVLSLIT
jgi:hypothetical protein